VSFRYGQFRTGFAETLPRREAIQFRDVLTTRGVDVKVVNQSKIGEDEYGNPIFSESSHTQKAFIEMKGRERTVPSGDLKLGSMRLFTFPWSAIREKECELEVDGVRYHISGLVEKMTYLEVEAERKVE